MQECHSVSIWGSWTHTFWSSNTVCFIGLSHLSPSYELINIYTVSVYSTRNCIELIFNKFLLYFISSHIRVSKRGCNTSFGVQKETVMVHSSDWPGRSTALCGGFYWLIYFVIILAHLQATLYAQHEYVAYCYRWSSMVCLSVSLCVLVTTVSPAKMDEPIKMPFWCGLVGWRNHLLDGGPDPSREGALLMGHTG